MINKIGTALSSFFKGDVNFGTIHILENDNYEEKIEIVFNYENQNSNRKL